MSKFEALKKRSQNGNSVDAALKSLQGGGFKDDPRIFFPLRDGAGKGSAIIRFLPELEDSNEFAVLRKHHSFTGPSGKKFFAFCPSSIGESCPICEANNSLDWKNDKDAARSKGWNPQYTWFSNVLVVKHAAQPEDEGQVRIYRFGKSIKMMIEEVMQPDDDDVSPIDVTDLWHGANFNFKIVNKSERANYEKSTWLEQSAIADNDDEIFKIWKSGYDLSEFVSPDKFQTYDELAKKFKWVMDESNSNVPLPPKETSPEPAASRLNVEANSQVQTTSETNADDLEDDVPF